MSYTIIYNNSEEELLQKAGDALAQFLKKNEVLLLLSGGSAVNILEKIDSSVVGKDTTISVLDERYTTDASISNFSHIINTTFYRSSIANGAFYIDTRVARNETINQLAERFEHALRNWKTAHPKGIIVSTQGIGSDGHTSGIMPYPENPLQFEKLFCNENDWVVGYDAENKNPFPMRVTTTIPFLKMIDHSIVYAVGDNKKEILKKANSSITKLNEFPCKVIQDMKDVLLFTNQKM